MDIRKYMGKKFADPESIYQGVRRAKHLKATKKILNMKKEDYPIELAKMYEAQQGHPLDWNNLKTYTEKMQWEKLYDDNPNKVLLADKYLVRQWVADKVGEDYLIPLLGVWDKYEDIDFDKLPTKFMLKTNNGSGTNYFVKDKNKINHKKLSKVFEDWLKMDFGASTFEFHYSQMLPKIIAEEYIDAMSSNLLDYRFMCFGGKPFHCWVDLEHENRNIYDMDWKQLPWVYKYNCIEQEIKKPDNFDEMKRIVTILAEGFPHVRVDLYNVNGKIYFGEMTFTNASGFGENIQTEYDELLGEQWNIN